MNVSEYIAVVVPHTVKDVTEVREAIMACTKEAGGRSDTEQHGVWYDSNGGEFSEPVTRMQWNYQFGQRAKMLELTKALAGTLLDAGELAVFTESVIGGQYEARIIG